MDSKRKAAEAVRQLQAGIGFIVFWASIASVIWYLGNSGINPVKEVMLRVGSL